jgi:ABC-type antimicrobial peptide transport system permease subunit
MATTGSTTCDGADGGPVDVPTNATVCSALTAVVLLASYLPARRAARLYPMIAFMDGVVGPPLNVR